MLTLHSVKSDTLTDMTNQMTDKVGLVHGLPYVADRQGFAATLEQVRLMCPWHARCSQSRCTGEHFECSLHFHQCGVFGAALVTDVYLLTGIFWHVPPAVLHLCKCYGDQVRDGDVMSDEERRAGPGGRIGCLRSVHC